MSDTETKPLPPMETLFQDDKGVTMWRAQLTYMDLALMHWKGLLCVRVGIKDADGVAKIYLPPADARHVAALLIAHAETCEKAPKDGEAA